MYDACMNQTTINVSLTKGMMEDLHEMVAAGHFASISEAIRAAVNGLKLQLLPKYQVVQLNPTAEKRFEKSLTEYRAGKGIKVKSFADLLS